MTEMGAMLTMFTTGIKPGEGRPGEAVDKSGTVAVPNSGTGKSGVGGTRKEDNSVMDTKLKIIEILQFILDVRLDYRISSLLSIFKREFDESNG